MLIYQDTNNKVISFMKFKTSEENVMLCLKCENQSVFKTHYCFN